MLAFNFPAERPQSRKHHPHSRAKLSTGQVSASSLFGLAQLQKHLPDSTHLRLLFYHPMFVILVTLSPPLLVWGASHATRTCVQIQARLCRG